MGRKKSIKIITIILSLTLLCSYILLNKKENSKKEVKFNCVITDSKCQKNFAFAFSNFHTPKETLSVLYKLDQEKKIGYCHDIVHEAGRQAFKIYKNDKNFLKIALPGELTFICSGGYFHGMLQEAGIEKNMDFINRAGKTLCVYGDSKLSANYRTEGCLHAIGHGFYLSKLPLGKTIESCRELSYFYQKEDNDERKYMEFKCINGFAMEEIFHVTKDNPPITTSKQIREICSISPDPICGAAFVRDVLENNVLRREQYIPRGKDLHQYCSDKKIFKGFVRDLCEYNIGFAVVSLFADNPPPEVLAETINEICYTIQCAKAGYGTNNVHGMLNTPEYSKRFCSNVKLIPYNECYDAMINVANSVIPQVDSQIDRAFRDPAIFIKKSSSES